MSGSKINVAKQAIEYIKNNLHPEMILGIGTGSTVNFFIEELKEYRHKFAGAVSSSDASSKLLNENGIEVFSLNDVIDIAYYIDGADEVSPENCLIKGGGGAHTREKIVASASNEFICIVDQSKMVNLLGAFPLPIEVIPESRSLVASGFTFDPYVDTTLPSFEIKYLLKFHEGVKPDSAISFL